MSSYGSFTEVTFLGYTQHECISNYYIWQDLGSVTAYSPSSLAPSLRRLSMAYPDSSYKSGGGTERELSAVFADAIAQCKARGANCLTSVIVGRNEVGSLWVSGRATFAKPMGGY